MEKVSQPLIIKCLRVKHWCCFCCICLGKEAQMLFQSPFISMVSNHFLDLGLQGRWKHCPLGSDFQRNGETEHMPSLNRWTAEPPSAEPPCFTDPTFHFSPSPHYASWSIIQAPFLWLHCRERSLVFSKKPFLAALQFRVPCVHKPPKPPV